MLKPTRIVVSCDPEFYWGRPEGYGNCWVFHFSGIKQFACCTISAPAELFVLSFKSNVQDVPTKIEELLWINGVSITPKVGRYFGAIVNAGLTFLNRQGALKFNNLQYDEHVSVLKC